MHGRSSMWTSLEVEELVRQLGTNTLYGLSSAESTRRLIEAGPNELQAPRRISPWAIFVEQFKSVIVLILIVAVGLSVFLGHGLEAIAIGVIVLFATLLGFIQEYRAERALEALRQMAAPTATVLRDGKEIEILSRELVSGDVIILRTGDKIPADARLIEAINLQADEATLTGESIPVEKHTSPLPNDELPIGDRKNMVFAGTAATYGRGRAVVVATGMQTEFGRIARLLATVEIGQTPLQNNLKRVGHALAYVALAVVILIVGLGFFRGQPLLEMLVFGIALAVAVVPEALPAVVTISLAIGVQRMVKRNALIRRLPAVETLGSTSVICSDKTGTLTKDEMTVRKIVLPGQSIEVSGAGYEPQGAFSCNGNAVDLSGPIAELLRAAVLASDAQLTRSDERWDIKGDPTEGALVVVAAKAGLHKSDLDVQFPRLSEIPFTSESKRMTTLHALPVGSVAYAKGAPEVILNACTRQLTNAGENVLDDARRAELLAEAQRMASEALRVLAVATKTETTLTDAECGMTFLGLMGMIDPPRPEAQAAIQTCRQAGIHVVMITGDHPLTAQAVAKELGLFVTGRVVTGAELEGMSDAELEARMGDIDIFARVSPAHKLRVVTALQGKGHVVAMTGDGVNDAPALKKADIGIAMGVTGTDVSKEAAVMTLIDDNFASIVAAVEEGRGIFGNIKKYLTYLLSSNIGEITLIAGASVLEMPMPLTAVQILYINLATDGLPALALAVDPYEPDLMRRPPRSSGTGMFTRPVVSLMVVGGLWSALANLSLFTWALQSGRSLEESITMTFISLALIQFFKAYNFRSDRHSVLDRPFSNKWLNLAVVWEGVLLILIVYVPFLQGPLGTFGLSLMDWTIVITVAFTITPVLELAKWMERRGWFGKLT